MKKQYIGIDPKKVLVGTLLITGLFIGYDYQNNKKETRFCNEYHELYLDWKNVRGRTIDISEEIVIKDVNLDGLEDLVLKLKSGEDFILYKTREGYFVREGEK